MNKVEAANELAFRVGISGHGGHLRVEPLYTEESDGAVNSLPDFVSVSILSDCFDFPRLNRVKIRLLISEN